MTEQIHKIRPPMRPTCHIRGNGFSDLTGQTVNGLHVLGLGVQQGRWVCRCECGGYVHRHTKALKSGGALPCDECKTRKAAA